MNIDHIQFCVDDAQAWADWFVRVFQFQTTYTAIAEHTQTIVVQAGDICFVLRSPLNERSPLTTYQRQHPMGVSNVAFRVKSLDRAIARAQAHGATLLHSPQTYTSAVGQVRWVQCSGWGDLRHTLIERRGLTPHWPFEAIDGMEPSLRAAGSGNALSESSSSPVFAIDHVVLNVAMGDLERAVTQYEDWFGFERRQSFSIQTPHSGLCSQVLVHPEGTAQLPINEPTSATSQIQDFLDVNRGSGIQHIALETSTIVEAIAQLREQGLSFISVPSTYYEQLQQRQDNTLSQAQLQAIAQAKILVDWQSDNPAAILWQTFTQPIFGKPTFFFEIIQRRTPVLGSVLEETEPSETRHKHYAQGFGEGNFQALFEAIEREQLNRTTVR